MPQATVEERLYTRKRNACRCTRGVAEIFMLGQSATARARKGGRVARCARRLKDLRALHEERIKGEENSNPNQTCECLDRDYAQGWNWRQKEKRTDAEDPKKKHNAAEYIHTYSCMDILFKKQSRRGEKGGQDCEWEALAKTHAPALPRLRHTDEPQRRKQRPIQMKSNKNNIYIYIF